jgi:hypothetical protein
MEVGVGKYVAFNAALGIWREALFEENPGVSPLDLDFGVKVYPYRKWLYLGINYGIIEETIEEHFCWGKRISRTFDKTHGFTFSVGIRTGAWRGLYTSVFIGTTDNYEVNHPLWNVPFAHDESFFFPHFGLMLGYELTPRK